MSAAPQKLDLLMASMICGLLLTLLLSVIAVIVGAREGGCIFLWQACLLQRVIHTPDNALHEGSPTDLFVFGFGVVLGIPIYSVLFYFALRYWQKVIRKEPK
jgi:hypothetical protein